MIILANAEIISTSNNRASDKPHGTRYRLCAKLALSHILLLVILKKNLGVSREWDALHKTAILLRY